MASKKVKPNRKNERVVRETAAVLNRATALSPEATKRIELERIIKTTDAMNIVVQADVLKGRSEKLSDVETAELNSIRDAISRSYDLARKKITTEYERTILSNSYVDNSFLAVQVVIRNLEEGWKVEEVEAIIKKFTDAIMEYLALGRSVYLNDKLVFESVLYIDRILPAWKAAPKFAAVANAVLTKDIINDLVKKGEISREGASKIIDEAIKAITVNVSNGYIVKLSRIVLMQITPGSEQQVVLFSNDTLEKMNEIFQRYVQTGESKQIKKYDAIIHFNKTLENVEKGFYSEDVKAPVLRADFVPRDLTQELSLEHSKAAASKNQDAAHSMKMPHDKHTDHKGEATKKHAIGLKGKVAKKEATKKVSTKEATKKVALKEATKKVSTKEATKKITPKEATKKVALKEATKKIAPKEATKKIALKEATKKIAPKEATKKVALKETTKKITPKESTKKVVVVKKTETKKVNLKTVKVSVKAPSKPKPAARKLKPNKESKPVLALPSLAISSSPLAPVAITAPALKQDSNVKKAQPTKVVAKVNKPLPTKAPKPSAVKAIKKPVVAKAQPKPVVAPQVQPKPIAAKVAEKPIIAKPVPSPVAAPKPAPSAKSQVFKPVVDKAQKTSTGSFTYTTISDTAMHKIIEDDLKTAAKKSKKSSK